MQQPTLNNRYRLQEKIGEGGMAEVYQAEDSLLERSVAVKILRPQYAADPEFIARFQQEARSAARVAHPNIVSIYDVGSTPLLPSQPAPNRSAIANAAVPVPYIVMELVDGQNLKDLIRQSAQLSIGRSVEVASQILAALAFAHQKGLIHRDIKPQNILVATDGQVKVTDFGIARAANTPQITATGVVLATVQYCSPEQATGKPALAASDIYSVGVVLYEMLTGVLPFEAESPVAVALKHIQEPPRPPRELNPLIPRQLEAIVLRALAKEPERRFQSAAEMRQALRTYQQFGDEPTATFRSVNVPTPIGTSPAISRQQQAAAVSLLTRQPRARGVDWIAIVLGVLVFLLVAGAIPLGLRLYSNYSASNQEQPTSTTAPVRVVSAPTSTLPAPTTTSQSLSPTAAPTAAPTASATPTSAPALLAPHLIGKPFEQARKDAEAQKIHLRIAGERSDSTFDPMVIVEQVPAPDSVLQPDAIVDVIVSRGPDKMSVDSVVGLSAVEARYRLLVTGFLVDLTDDYSDNVPAGTIISQKPDAGQPLARGGTVALVASKGPRPATPTPTPPAFRPPEGNSAWVPGVVGLTEAEARRLIDRAGLRAGDANYQTETDVPTAMRPFFRSIQPGSVLSVTPNVGDKLHKNDVVHIAVRKP